ncbi:MAG TPA: DNA-3-methyladenine glycosylase [Pirellulaceae bacterium]|nr:DNA-3-methyladenine glycosylase [Pirellulaceae bacterium]
MLGDTLPQSFYDRDVVSVARELLGKILVRRSRDGICFGRIVETEAYLATGDSASHSFRGRTKKNATMFGPPGFAYVYPIHSRYCMNAVTEERGRASAVLIRAVEPLSGIEVLKQRRGTENLLDLCRGPARLCEAFAVDRRFDGWDMSRSTRLWIANADSAPKQEFRVTSSPRIGVTSAKDSPLRFFMDGSRFVSGLRRLHSTRP